MQRGRNKEMENIQSKAGPWEEVTSGWSWLKKDPKQKFLDSVL